MRQKYGDRITTEFVDLALPENKEQYANVLEAIEKYNLPLPLVAVNGQVRLAGGVDYYAIMDILEAKNGE